MPIFAYKCPVCGNKAEVLQKYNDPAPRCHVCMDPKYVKLTVMERQLTTAGFEIKGLLR